MHRPIHPGGVSRRARLPTTLSMIPGDLLLEIAYHLDSRQELVNFSLTSNRVFHNTSPVLYSTVILNSTQQCIHTLGMLYRCPDVARHVRKLVVRPNACGKSSGSLDNGAVASAAVRKLASAMRLDALINFAWDGDDTPYHDDMWFALRICCPQLRYISTTIGSYLPTSSSHLFDFNDLTGFSLTLNPGFYDHHVDAFLDDELPASLKFWDMLIKRCPNLEELSINGISSLPTDARTLVNGRWPNLRQLSLGDVSLEWHAPTSTTGPKSPFITFLEAHPNLLSLKVSRNVPSAHFSTLDPVTLPRLTEFSGTLEQLQALPHLHGSLKSVTFREPMQTRELTPLAVAGVLQNLTQLVELRISFVLHSMYDSSSLLRSLIASCPQIRHLELTCAHKPSFQLESFSKTIRSFAKLQSLNLTIVKYPGDESLASGAARIARTNPRLERFNLTFLPPSQPLPLPFSFPLVRIPAKAVGTYTLECDEYGLPLSLTAFEISRRVWPWGLGVSSSRKRYILDLRPPGCPGRGQKGLLNLILERSSAGEELRMILFCFLLVCLAMWGFASSERGEVRGIIEAL